MKRRSVGNKGEGLEITGVGELTKVDLHKKAHLSGKLWTQQELGVQKTQGG